jgi:N-acyl homoserine lactone hydrolase
LMLQKQVDGVSNDRVSARQTLERVYRYCHTTPTVYLPSHDPDALDRLANRQVVASPPAPAVPMIEAG